MGLVEFMIEKIFGFILVIAEKILEACILGVFGLVEIVTSNDVSEKYTLILVVLFTISIIVLINYFRANKGFFNIKNKRKKRKSSKIKSSKSNKKVSKPKTSQVKKSTTRKKAKKNS